MKTSRKPFQGILHLVLIGTATTTLNACSPSPADTRQPMSRARYASLQDCQKDWGSPQDCEAVQGGGGAAYYHGPYYSSGTGKVFHYDGRESVRAGLPTRAQAVTSETLSPREVFASKGRYADTPAHPGASAAKSSGARARSGGFGGTGRAFSSVGG